MIQVRAEPCPWPKDRHVAELDVTHARARCLEALFEVVHVTGEVDVGNARKVPHQHSVLVDGDINAHHHVGFSGRIARVLEREVVATLINLLPESWLRRGAMCAKLHVV